MVDTVEGSAGRISNRVGSTHFNDYVFEEMMDPSEDVVVQFLALRDDQLELRLFQVSAASEVSVLC
jgi:hypothetical protein